MNIKKMLEKQKMLDSYINSFRERTKIDMRLSLIAELIEFNEELECSHKTWKAKVLDEKKQLEEFVDCWFFALHELSFSYEPLVTIREDLQHDSLEVWFEHGRLSELEIQNTILESISLFSDLKNTDIINVFITLSVLGGIMGYTMEQIEQEYNRKWKINMGRVGKDWR